MVLAVFPIIIDLHLNLNMVQNEAFYFLSSVQAPLTTGEVPWLSAIMQNLEDMQEVRNCAEPLASSLIGSTDERRFSAASAMRALRFSSMRGLRGSRHERRPGLDGTQINKTPRQIGA